MLVCYDCGNVFEKPAVITETHGFQEPPFEDFLVCPVCKGTDIAQANRCSICGEWIRGSYIVVNDGQIICDECYVRGD